MWIVFILHVRPRRIIYGEEAVGEGMLEVILYERSGDTCGAIQFNMPNCIRRIIKGIA